MRTLIAGGSPHFRTTLSSILRKEGHAGEHAFPQNLATTLPMLPAFPWAMVFVDLELPGLQALADVVTVVNAVGRVPVIALANGHHSEVHQLCRLCGMTGLIDQAASADEVGRAISMVKRGGLAFPDILAVPTGPVSLPSPPLTTKQLQVFELIAGGKSNKEIAKTLNLSPNTVKAHVSAVLQRLQVRSRAEAIVIARKGWAAPA